MLKCQRNIPRDAINMTKDVKNVLRNVSASCQKYILIPDSVEDCLNVKKMLNCRRSVSRSVRQRMSKCVKNLKNGDEMSSKLNNEEMC